MIVLNWAVMSVWDGLVFVDGVREGEMGKFQIIFCTTKTAEKNDAG